MAPPKPNQFVQDGGNSTLKSAVLEVSRDTPRRFVSSGILTLYVGKKRKKFEIHKDLLRDKSKYFEAVLAKDSPWYEAKTNEVYWDDEGEGISIESVDIWIDWLYGKNLVGQKRDTLLRCYKLADKRMMLSFKNDVVDAIRQCYSKGGFSCSAETIVFSRGLGLQQTALYECLLQSMVRSILKHPAAWMGSNGKGCVTDLAGLLKNSEIAQEILAAIMRFQLSPWNDPFFRRGCFFHDHSDGSTCQKAT